MKTIRNQNNYEFSENNADTFYRLLIHFFQVDGEFSEEEKEVLSNYLRMVAGEEEESQYERILNLEAGSEEQLAQDLSDIDEQDIKFRFLLQAISLVSVDGFKTSEKESYQRIIKQIDLNHEAIETLKAVFIEPDIKCKNILVIGNDSNESDIVKSRSSMLAYIIKFQDDYYLLARKSSGLIHINEKPIFDSIAYKLDIDNRLFIDKKVVAFADIMLRFELKTSDIHMMFSVVEPSNESNKHQYELHPGEREDAIGTVMIRGCHIAVLNKKGSTPIAIERYEKGTNIYSGCVDDKIIIDNKFNFDLSWELPSIVYTESISSKIIEKDLTVIGNTDDCDILFPHRSKSINSRLELELIEPQRFRLNVDEANGEVLLNGCLINDNDSIVKPGDVIEVHRNYILFDSDKRNIRVKRNKIHNIEIDDLVFHYKDGKSALNHIHINNKAKDFICVMGPSGCGKSTLMRVLSGYQTPDSFDSISFNGHSLYRQFDHFKNHIGYVTQDDLLFENLTVYENLFYYGQIKAPHLSDEVLNKKIDELLDQLSMTLKKNLMVGSPEKRVLSGGERKRLNIALELITDCDVLYLDEPTSGLSSFDTQKIIDLLRYHTMQGKIIYVVIHQPSLDVFSKFTHLCLLDKGGYLAYFGATDQALSYFSKYSLNQNKLIHSPEEMLETLEAVKHTPDGEVVYEQDLRGNKIPMRVKTPKQWSEEYQIRRYEIIQRKRKVRHEEAKSLPNAHKLNQKQKIVQFRSLFLRNFANRFKDIPSTILSVAIPALLAFFLTIVLRHDPTNEGYTMAENSHLPKFLFLSTVVFIFLSTSNSIGEIFKDRLFLDKEKLIGYSNVSYLFGKITTLAFINFYQIVIYCLVSFTLLKIPITILFEGHLWAGYFPAFVAYSFIGSMSITCLALFISSYLRTEKAAFLCVPMIIVPQILFGGMFVNFNELKSLNLFSKQRAVPLVANAAHSRWMYEGYLNIIRYHSPNKFKPFANSRFREKQGNYNNEAVIDLFRTYNLSQSKNKKQAMKKDKWVAIKMSRFSNRLRAMKEGNLTFMKYWYTIMYGNVNYFPYYKKILYPFVLPTTIYNAIVMALMSLVFSLLTLFRLNRMRGKFMPTKKININPFMAH